jgi:hypothetical protein
LRERDLVVDDETDAFVAGVRYVQAFLRGVSSERGGGFAQRNEFDDAVVLDDREILRAGTRGIDFIAQRGEGVGLPSDAGQLAQQDALAHGGRARRDG